MNNRFLNSRRALSLVELLVVMSGCSVVLTTSAALIHRAMHAQSRTRSFFDVERNALRLSGQFRRDVHRAIGTVANDPTDPDVFLRLELPDHQTVAYRHADGRVVRTLSRSGSRTSREEFSFTSANALELRQEEAPRRLILTITGVPDERLTTTGGRQFEHFRDPPVSVRTEAVLGRDWRFADPAANEELPP